MHPDANFQVFNEDIEFKLKEISDILGSSLPPGWGFSLLLFDFNAADEGSLFYASNGRREDLIQMMKEFIALNEQKEPNEEE